MDFVADILFNGRWFRALTVVDNLNRKCLANHVEKTIKEQNERRKSMRGGRHSRKTDRTRYCAIRRRISYGENYGATRHPTTTAIAEEYDEATAKQAPEHDTSSAFGRYCQARNMALIKAAKMVKAQREGTVQYLYNKNKKRKPANS